LRFRRNDHPGPEDRYGADLDATDVGRDSHVHVLGNRYVTDGDIDQSVLVRLSKYLEHWLRRLHGDTFREALPAPPRMICADQHILIGEPSS
jgi:hypothetical protein